MIHIKHLLEPLLNLEGTDGAQALKRGGKVGENRTPSYRKYTRQKTQLSEAFNIFKSFDQISKYNYSVRVHLILIV